MDIFQAKKQTMVSNRHFSGCFFCHLKTVCKLVLPLPCLYKRKQALLGSNLSGII
jgi:hypothetical protein